MIHDQPSTSPDKYIQSSIKLNLLQEKYGDQAFVETTCHTDNDGGQDAKILISKPVNSEKYNNFRQATDHLVSVVVTPEGTLLVHGPQDQMNKMVDSLVKNDPNANNIRHDIYDISCQQGNTTESFRHPVQDQNWDHENEYDQIEINKIDTWPDAMTTVDDIYQSASKQYPTIIAPTPDTDFNI